MGKTKREEQNYSKQPFLLSVDEIINHLQTTTDSGLSSAQTKQYLEKYGENHLDGSGGIPWYSILGKQISNAMILVSSLNPSIVRFYQQI
jgi:P-type Na+/K+ transporter